MPSAAVAIVIVDTLCVVGGQNMVKMQMIVGKTYARIDTDE